MKFQNTTLSGKENKEAYDKLREQIKLYNVDQLSTDMPGLINKIEVLSHAKQLDSVGQEIAKITGTLEQAEEDKIKALDVLDHKNGAWRSEYFNELQVNIIEANIDLSLNELIEKYDKMYNAIDLSVNETASGLGELYHLVQNNSITYETLPTRFEYRNEGILMRKLIQYLRVHEVLSLHENNHITTEPVKDVEKTLRDVFDKAVKYDLDTSTAESDKTEVLKEIVDNAEMQVNLKIDHDLISSYNIPIEPNENYLSSVESFNKYKNYQQGLWNPSKSAYSGMTDGSNNPLDWNVKRVRIIQSKINEHRNDKSKTQVLEDNNTQIQLFESRLNLIKEKYKIDVNASLLDVTTETEEGTIKKTYSVTVDNPPPQKEQLEEIGKEISVLNTIIPRLEGLSYEGFSSDSKKFGPEITDSIITKVYDKEKLDEGKKIYNDWVEIEKVLKAQRDFLDKPPEEEKPVVEENQDLVDARKELEDAKTAVKDAETELEKDKAALETVKEEVGQVDTDKINEDISKAKISVNDAISNINTLKLEVDKEQEKFDPIKAENDKLKADLEKATTELKDISDSIPPLETKQPLVNQELANIQETVNTDQAALTAAQNAAANANVEEKQTAVTNAQTEVTNAQTALDALDEEARAGSDEETALTAAQQALNTAQDALKADQDLVAAQTAAQEKLTQSQASLTAKQTEKTETDTALAQAKENKTAKNIELQELEVKLLESNTTLTAAETALNTAKENVTAGETTKTEKDKELADLEKQLSDSEEGSKKITDAEEEVKKSEETLQKAKDLKVKAEEKIAGLTPEEEVKPEEITERLDVQLPLDLNKTFTCYTKI